MSLHQLFVEKLQELAGVEKLLIAGIPALVAAATEAELQAAFADHLKQTERHAERIEDTHASLRLELKTEVCKPMVAMIADASKPALTKPEGTMRDLAIPWSGGEESSTLRLRPTLQPFHWQRRSVTVMPRILLAENLQEELKAAEHLKKISKTLLKRAQEEASK